MPDEPATGEGEDTGELALFPLNVVLFPGGPLPLRIFEPRYVDLVRNCMRTQTPFGVVQLLSGAEAGVEPGVATETAPVGTSARIVDFFPLEDGLLGIYCLGDRRFRIERRWQQADGLHRAAVRWLGSERGVALPAEYRHLGALMQRLLPRLGELYEAVEPHADEAGWVGYRLAEILPVALAEKQAWLELTDPLERLAQLAPLIRRDA